MARSIGLAHIIRQDDGTSAGVWGVFVLKSAFQPIFAFDRGKVTIAAFEGLIRPFRDGEGLSPTTFFNLIRTWRPAACRDADAHAASAQRRRLP